MRPDADTLRARLGALGKSYDALLRLKDGVVADLRAQEAETDRRGQELEQLRPVARAALEEIERWRARARESYAQVGGFAASVHEGPWGDAVTRLIESAKGMDPALRAQLLEGEQKEQEETAREIDEAMRRSMEGV